MDYDGINKKQASDGSWRIRHAYLDYWIVDIPTEYLADKILQAFEKIRETEHFNCTCD